MIAPRALSAAVFVGTVRVGTLLLEHGTRTTFRFDENYLNAADRPVLGRWFEDRLKPDFELVESQCRVPSFFGHVLPDSTSILRRLLASHANVPEHLELQLLIALGDDLPGAMHVKLLSATGEIADPPPPAPQSERAGKQILRMSLAGMQFKLSTREEGQRLTIPVRGEEGRFLVKFPDPRYSDLPRIESATLSWARASGIEVPPHLLVDVALVDRPEGWGDFKETQALRIARYDRSDNGRIHQEDFAQVLAIASHDHEAKYRGALDRVARVVASVCPEDFPELLRRFAFVILSGNTDAHLKNWSLLYPDGKKPRLSPAYDQVFTLFIKGGPDQLGLHLRSKREFSAITLGDFENLAEHCGMSASEARRTVGEFTARARATFRELEGEYPADIAPLVRDHLGRLKL